MSGNDIATRQNEQQFLELQAAKNCLYDQARSISRGQVWLCVVVPFALATAKAIDPTFSPWAALYAAFALALEPELDSFQERLRSKGALVQEVFDRDLFQLAWPTESIGRRPSTEEIKRWGRRYRTRSMIWRDWYPKAVGRLPLAIGRVACQRTNGWWDSALREYYATGLMWVGYVVVGVMLVVGAARQQTVLEMALVATFLAPVVRWLQRTVGRQRSSAVARKRLFEWAERLCERWRAGQVSDAELEGHAAAIQRDTYEQRRTAPMVPRWLYLWSRSENEDAVGAAIVAQDETG